MQRQVLVSNVCTTAVKTKGTQQNLDITLYPLHIHFFSWPRANNAWNIFSYVTKSLFWGGWWPSSSAAAATGKGQRNCHSHGCSWGKKRPPFVKWKQFNWRLQYWVCLLPFLCWMSVLFSLYRIFRMHVWTHLLIRPWPWRCPVLPPQQLMLRDGNILQGFIIPSLLTQNHFIYRLCWGDLEELFCSHVFITWPEHNS